MKRSWRPRRRGTERTRRKTRTPKFQRKYLMLKPTISKFEPFHLWISKQVFIFHFTFPGMPVSPALHARMMTSFQKLSLWSSQRRKIMWEPFIKWPKTSICRSTFQKTANPWPHSSVSFVADMAKWGISLVDETVSNCRQFELIKTLLNCGIA